MVWVALVIGAVGTMAATGALIVALGTWARLERLRHPRTPPMVDPGPKLYLLKDERP